MNRPEQREEEEEGEEEVGCARTTLFIASATVGVTYLIGLGRMGLIEAIVAFAIMLLYPLVGALVVGVCELIRDLAFPKATDWSRVEHLLIAAFWPLSLLYWLVVGPTFAVINRVFR